MANMIGGAVSGLMGKVMPKKTMPVTKSMFRGKGSGLVKPATTPVTKPAMAAPKAKVKIRRSAMNTRTPY